MVWAWVVQCDRDRSGLGPVRSGPRVHTSSRPHGLPTNGMRVWGSTMLAWVLIICIHIILVNQSRSHNRIAYLCNFLSACIKLNIDGLVQERCNFSAIAMELHLSCINPSIWWWNPILLTYLKISSQIDLRPHIEPGTKLSAFPDYSFKRLSWMKILVSKRLGHFSSQLIGGPKWVDALLPKYPVFTKLTLFSMYWFGFNSLRPSDAYMRRYSNHHWFR